jgi:small-conductance mechanosensitive channel
MIGSIISQLPNARQFESTIDDVFNKIAKDLQESEIEEQQTPPDPRMIAVQNQAQKNAQDFEIKKEQNRLKADELAMRKDIENQKVAQENIEANMQFALKRQQQANGEAVSANITTGRVPEF